jgi:hypothetical protein
MLGCQGWVAAGFDGPKENEKKGGPNDVTQTPFPPTFLLAHQLVHFTGPFPTTPLLLQYSSSSSHEGREQRAEQLLLCGGRYKFKNADDILGVLGEEQQQQGTGGRQSVWEQANMHELVGNEA